MRCVALLLVCAALLLATTTVQAVDIPCPIDCGATPDVQAEVDACVLQAQLCNPFEEAVPRSQWQALLNISDPNTVTPSTPTQFYYVPDGELVDRVSCAGLVQNDTNANGTLIYVCIQRFFCYIDPDARIFVELSGVCLSTALNFPGVKELFYTGPAQIVGGGFVTDPVYSTNVVFSDLVFNGGGTTAGFFADCMQNSNYTFQNVVFVGWLGDYVLRAESCVYHATWVLDNVTMADVPGTPIYLEGMDSIDINEFYCARCAQLEGSRCAYLKMAWTSTRRLALTRSSCFRVQDQLAPRCRYCLTGDDGFCGSRCNEGIVQVYDRRATEQFANCDLVETDIVDYFTQMLVPVVEFEQICRVYSPPLCNFIQVIDSQNFTRAFTFPGGDIVWQYDAPLICVPGGVVTPVPGPFFLTEFNNQYGDPVPLQALPPLPPSPGFVDPSFENVGIEWTLSVPEFLSQGFVTLLPRTGANFLFCTEGTSRSAQQEFQVEFADLNQAQTFGIWAQPFSSPAAAAYNNRFVRLLIDGIEVSRFEGVDLFNEMTPGSYQLLEFDPWNATVLGSHTLTLQCNFNGGAGGLKLGLDDAQWTGTLAGTLLDPSFEPHILDWTDVPQGEVILPEGQGPNCPARTGDYRYVVTNGDLHSVRQTVTFANNGVYAVEAFVQRRNSAANYDGLFITLFVDVTNVGQTPLNSATLPSEDSWTYVPLVGQIVITAAPEVHDITIQTDFTAPPGGGANLCLDDVSLLAIGTIGVVPDTYGFSSQTISSAPFIVNETCDCSNFTAPPRNETLLPCAYAISDEVVCVEEEPFCCAQSYLNKQPLSPNVFWQVCSDLANASCVFLLNCDFDTVGGEVLNCTQLQCPQLNTTLYPPMPLSGEMSVDYLYANCTVLDVSVQNGTVAGSATPDVEVAADGFSVAYTDVQYGKVWFVAPPSDFFMNCALAGDPTVCLLYSGCTLAAYNTTDGAYTLSGCTLLNCSQPYLLEPTLTAELDACAVLATNVTVPTTDGGWVRQANGTLSIFDEALWLYWLNQTLQQCETMFEVFPLAEASLATGCTPHAYFRECPCCPTVGDFTVPPGGNLTDPDPGQNAQQGVKTPDDFYICEAGVARCRCDAAAIDASNPAPANSATWWIANAPDTLDSLRLVDNRAQQHQYGWVIEQLTHPLLASNTIAVPYRFDEQAVCRLLLRNDNEFTAGELHDCLQGNPGGPYTTWCDIIDSNPLRPPCPLPLVSQDEADCFVDDRATADILGFGVTIFNIIQDAVDRDGCDSIYIRFSTSSSYFEESILFDKGNKDLVLWSLEGAIIVGTHTITTNTDNITFIGLRFIHPVDNQLPLLSIVRDEDDNMNFINIKNCEIDGGGCRKCGILDTKRLNDLTINFTAINDFEFFTLKLDDAERVVLTQNTISNAVGRGFLIQYKQGFVIDQNACIDCRGGASLRGAAIWSLTSKNNDACDQRSLRYTCLLRHNIQIVNVTETTERYQDLCFYISRGNLNITQMYDNACRLAQTSVVFIKTLQISSGQLIDGMMLNPMCSSSLFQIRDPDNPQYDPRTIGPDWVVRGVNSFVTPGQGDGFEFEDNVETDYDEAPFLIPIDPIRCESNRNWSPLYAFGTGVQTPRMGVERFHNASIGVEFCRDRREVTPVLGGTLRPAFVLHVRSFNGSRLSPENITVYRDCWLRGDDTEACCQMPQFRPALVGTGNRVLTDLFNMTNLTLAMPVEPALNEDLWASGPQLYPVDDQQVPTSDVLLLTPSELCFDTLEWDGRYVTPQGSLAVGRFLVGKVVPLETFDPSSNGLPPFTESFFMMRDSEMINWRAYNPLTPIAGGNFINLPGQFPFSDGFIVAWAQRVNTSSVALLDNVTLHDVDHSGVALLNANNQTIQHSRFLNCSGRAFGNRACVSMRGNDISRFLTESPNFNLTEAYYSMPTRMYQLNNTYLNTRPVLYPTDSSNVEPGYVAATEIVDFANITDYCLINVTAEGLPLPIRQAGTFNLTLLNCPLYTQPPSGLDFPDPSRILRAQCLAGNLEFAQGTVHDLAYGEGETDIFAETIWCDSTLPDFVCCPIETPSLCWVVQTPELLLPSNPWVQQNFIFASLNDAVVNCNATRRVIRVIGSGDPFLVGDTTPKVYTEVLSATVPLVSVRGIGGPLEIQSGAGVTWRSAGNSLNTQCVFTTLVGFYFEHDGTVATAIWEQWIGSGTDACNLRFLSDEWNVTVDERAMLVVVASNFTIADNLFYGSLVAGTRRGVELAGNGSCLEDPVRVQGSVFRDFLGFGLSVTEVARYVIKNNNFDNVGGQDFITQIPYSVYASVCLVPPAPVSDGHVQFVNNRVRTTQTVAAAVGEMATCWLGNVPLADRPFQILKNDCRGLAFGMRFENMFPDNSPGSDPKQQLRNLCINDQNGLTEGFKVPPLDQRFDLVRGPPADDASLVSDPKSAANEGRWCTSCCPLNEMPLIWGLVAALAACCLLLLACFLCTGCCTPSRYNDPLVDLVFTSPPDAVNPAFQGNGAVQSPFVWPERDSIDELAARPINAESAYTPLLEPAMGGNGVTRRHASTTATGTVRVGGLANR